MNPNLEIETLLKVYDEEMAKLQKELLFHKAYVNQVEEENKKLKSEVKDLKEMFNKSDK